MSPRHISHEARIVARERGLRRVRTATGWITVAATTGAVVLAGGYASALPGTTAAKTSAPNGGSNRHVTSPGTGGTGGSSPSASTKSAVPQSAATSAPATSLQPPTQAPATTSAPPQTTSGGS